MNLKKFTDVDLKGKRVLVRVDFNVPLAGGAVADDSRIKAALPTIARLLQREAKVILCSHLGRPKGQVQDDLRLDPVVPVLETLVNNSLATKNDNPVRVVKLDDCVGDEVKAAIKGSGPLDLILLENLRFHAGETSNDPEFCSQLAALADAYVSDAFGTVHRAHASTEGVAHLLPASAGFLVEKEIESLAKVINNPRKPLVIVLGGAKISGKLEVLTNLLPIADSILIGGAMANTLVKARGHETGRSLIEEDMVEAALGILAQAEEHDTQLMLPVDYVVADSIVDPKSVRTVPSFGISSNDICVDIGSQTQVQFRGVISAAKTVFWNGPMGVFEVEKFSHGTIAVARAMAEIEDSAHTVVGGGESVAAVNQAGMADRITHISTGGGASLEFVAGRELPGLKVLWD